MSTAGSWLATRRYFSICEKLYPQPWSWDSVTFTAHPTPLPRLIPWSIMSTLLITFSASSFGLIISKILGWRPSDPAFYPLVAIVWTFVAHATLLASDLCYLITQLSDTFRRGGGRPLANNTSSWSGWRTDHIGIAMHLLIATFLSGATLGFINPLFRSADPGFFLLRGTGLLPGSVTGKIIRSLSQGCIFIHGILVLLSALIPTALYLSLVISVLEPLARPGKGLFEVTGINHFTPERRIFSYLSPLVTANLFFP
ncbi:hypothetical protein Fcan01_16364 [Folsomia candida]|uniref:Uncharacterized protein n=1 Tax=Folsomia candida TaxID=158441 RepID=A0A226DTU4_FOLCA|nr:hypothetical protein Fcan01_16364 [Folsomia candida]